MLRWVIEAVNGRLKNMFSFFSQVIPMKSLPTTNRMLLIGLAIINKFSPPLYSENDFQKEIMEGIFSKIDEVNELEEEVKTFSKKSSVWKKVDEISAQDFPRLTLEDLKKITLGIYQLNMAKLYNNQHSYYGT